MLASRLPSVSFRLVMLIRRQARVSQHLPNSARPRCRRGASSGPGEQCSPTDQVLGFGEIHPLVACSPTGAAQATTHRAASSDLDSPALTLAVAHRLRLALSPLDARLLGRVDLVLRLALSPLDARLLRRVDLVVRVALSFLDRRLCRSIGGGWAMRLNVAPLIARLPGGESLPNCVQRVHRCPNQKVRFRVTSH